MENITFKKCDIIDMKGLICTIRSRYTVNWKGAGWKLDMRKKVHGRIIFRSRYCGYCILCLLREVISHSLVTPLFIFGVRSWNFASTHTLQELSVSLPPSARLKANIVAHVFVCLGNTGRSEVAADTHPLYYVKLLCVI